MASSRAGTALPALAAWGLRRRVHGARGLLCGVAALDSVGMAGQLMTDLDLIETG